MALKVLAGGGIGKKTVLEGTRRCLRNQEAVRGFGRAA
jgi:hypothetical protein